MANSGRFEAILDPLDLWLVWDNEYDTPAEFASMALIGMTEDEARTAALFLTNLCSQLEAGNQQATTSVA